MVKEDDGLISHQGHIDEKNYVDQVIDPELAENQKILVNQDENYAGRRDQVLENQG
jgi:hypothetical protein